MFPAPKFARWSLLGLGLAVSLAARGGEPLLTAADLKALERENAMWRLVQPAEDVATNLQHWRAAGFGDPEIAARQPQLAAMWEIPVDRQFGWLPSEAIAKIHEVDADYVIKLRAARLRQATGVQAAEAQGRTPQQVGAQWHRAILRALDYGEIAEFRLMDSAAAHRVQEWARHLILTIDERRTLVEWQRDFDAVHGAALAWAGATPRERRWHEEAQWELHDHMRELLGDDRFADYLGGASPAFNGMHDALEDLPGITPTVMLDLWRLRREHSLMRSQESSLEKRMGLAADVRAKVSTLLGEETYGRYAKDEEAAWLFPRPPATRQKPARP